MTVVETPATPGVIAGSATQCPGLTGQTYSISAVNYATTYNWVVPSGWSVTGGDHTTSITVTTGSYGDDGNIIVTAENSCGTSSESTLAVTVSHATPATPGAITGNTSQCAGLTGQTYSITAVPNATTYTWTVPTGWSVTGGAGTTDVTVTVGSAGQNGNITVTAGNSCGTSSASSQAVTVNALPTPTLTAPDNFVCFNTSHTYTTQTGGGIHNYLWNVIGGNVTSGGTTADNTVTVTWTTAGTETVSINYTNSNGCTAALPTVDNVTVNALPNPPTNNGDEIICSGQTIQPLTVSVGTNEYATWYDSGGNWAADGLSYTPDDAGTWYVDATSSTTGCTSANRTPVTLTINPIPTPSFTVQPGANICALTDVTYTTQTGGDLSNYVWNVPGISGTDYTITSGGIGTGDNTVTIQWKTYGSKTVTVNYDNSYNCAGASPASNTTTVAPTPQINAMSTTVCSAAGFTVTPQDVTNGTVPSGTNYSWSAPSGTGFTGGVAGSGSSLIGTLTNTTSGTVTATYTVTPVAGSCTGSDFTLTVTINPKPAIANMTSTICGGLPFSVTPVDVTDGIVPSGTTYSWSAPLGTGFSGGASGTDQTDIFGTLTNTTNGIVTATYTVTPTAGTCTGSTFTVTVTLDPTPAITAKTTTVCGGTLFTVTPVNNINDIVPAGTTYSWSLPSGLGFSGGASGTDETDIYGTLMNTGNVTATATYTVTPKAGSCTGSPFTVTVTINPTPVINTIPTSVCGGTAFTVTPANITNGIVPAGTNYTWTIPTGSGFDGGAAGSGPSITGTLTNIISGVATATYTVTPTAGSCTGSNFTVTVTLNPTPAITNMNTTVCGGSLFTVTPVDGDNGLVPSGTTFTWDAPEGSGFSGGASGTDQIDIFGTLTNTTNGIVTATYTVTPTAGTCTGSTFTVTVTLDPTPAITAKTTTVCGGTLFTVTPVNNINDIVPEGTTYSWSLPSGSGFSGGASGTDETDIFGTLMNTGNITATATYTVTPKAGSCTGSPFTVTVTLNPTPVINPIPTSVCGGTAFTVTPANITNGIVPLGNNLYLGCTNGIRIRWRSSGKRTFHHRNTDQYNQWRSYCNLYGYTDSRKLYW